MPAFLDSFIWAAQTLAPRIRLFSSPILAEGGDETRTLHFGIIVVAFVADGIGNKVAAAVTELTEKETRVVVLGHLQRAARLEPSIAFWAPGLEQRPRDSSEEGEFGRMVALLPPYVQSVPIRDAVRQTKTVPQATT